MLPSIVKRIEWRPAPHEHDLDRVARRIGERLTRRRACQALGGGSLAAVLAGVGLADVAAACRGVGERCRRNGQCCSGRCKRKKCRRAKGGPDIDPPTAIDIPLPPEFDTPILPERRRVAISGKIYIHDDESWGADEHSNHRVDEFRTALLNPGQLPTLVHLEHGCCGELRVEVALEVRLLDNGDAHVFGRVLLFEGTSERTTDLDGEAQFVLSIPMGGSVTKEVVLYNEDEGHDLTIVRLTFRNVAG